MKPTEEDMAVARDVLDRAHEAVSFGNIGKGIDIIAAALAGEREKARKMINERKHYHENLRFCELQNGNDARAECHLLTAGSFAEVERALTDGAKP